MAVVGQAMTTTYLEHPLAHNFRTFRLPSVVRLLRLIVCLVKASPWRQKSIQ